MHFIGVFNRGGGMFRRMDMAAVSRYLRREVPRSALAGLLVTAGLVTVRRLILPVLYWADSTKFWATLRPAR